MLCCLAPSLKTSGHITIGTATGVHAEQINGIYRKSAEIKNGRPVYAKEGDHDSTMCCFYTTNKTWTVASDTTKTANGTAGWAHTTATGLFAPQLAPEGGWRVVVGGDDPWREQKEVAAKSLADEAVAAIGQLEKDAVDAAVRHSNATRVW